MTTMKKDKPKLTEKQESESKLFTHNFKKEKEYPIPTGTFPMFI